MADGLQSYQRLRPKFTRLPEGLDLEFKVWDGSGRFHNYALLHTNIDAGKAFALLATSENYRDNENVICFINMASKTGDAVASGYYSGRLLQVTDGDAPKTTRTSGTRTSDIDLTWTSSYLEGAFDNELEEVICNNQIAIATFNGAKTIFNGEGRFIPLEGVDADEVIDTVQYVIDNIDTSLALQEFLGEEVSARLREVITAGQQPRA